MAKDEKKAMELGDERLDEVSGGDNADNGKSNESQSCHHPFCSNGNGLVCLADHDTWANCNDRD